MASEAGRVLAAAKSAGAFTEADPDYAPIKTVVDQRASAEPAEAAMLDAGIIVPGWLRTHYEFKLRPAGSLIGLSACRFFGTPPLGPNSHFFTIDAAECALVKANPLWTYEGLAFAADPPAAAGHQNSQGTPHRIWSSGYLVIWSLIDQLDNQ